ncbi:inorganic diphosphatase [Candidatus Nanosynsacchari sp. TM7_ANC_38.39_G1_1]|jgi:inorganic pyrophosphatase|uniref:inorganic diphosphatase n=1 Tax=Candidatus Nanosynsacchari sp. TM7_ANC_38.39_G1_1 TaxID=1986206 RepID=UPI00101C288E|nr:inorganic diphosphatase [Candidatus Nanosynsacchari sp. TM7_ANC_38.39_G1_1]RYC74266.1 Inorganic pyrophosphatase [Candidatus Nanosynsacchari sp. TM7_ANC_38.39_G1_1]
MADFNKVLDPGDVNGGLVNTVVEIPEGSRLKVEWDRQRAAFMLDRVEPKIFAKPCNYGFIPQTLDEDGDELDTLIICPEPLTTGVWLEARIIGVLRFEDDGEVDDKVVVVPADNRDDDRINSLDDIPQLVKQLEHHFTHYKDLKKPGSTIVKGWGDVEEAKTIVKQCIDRYNNQ